MVSRLEIRSYGPRHPASMLPASGTPLIVNGSSLRPDLLYSGAVKRFFRPGPHDLFFTTLSEPAQTLSSSLRELLSLFQGCRWLRASYIFSSWFFLFQARRVPGSVFRNQWPYSRSFRLLYSSLFLECALRSKSHPKPSRPVLRAATLPSVDWKGGVPSSPPSFEWVRRSYFYSGPNITPTFFDDSFPSLPRREYQAFSQTLFWDRSETFNFFPSKELSLSSQRWNH